MARPRKILSMQKGHINSDVKARREYEESLIKTGKDELEKVPNMLFVDAVAKKEYHRVLANLKSIDIIGNLDRNNLIVYANAYSTYMDVLNQIKDKHEPPTICTENGMKANPIYTMLDLAKKQMESAGKDLGMSASARLKIASEKVKGQEQQMSEMFGDI